MDWEYFAMIAALAVLAMATAAFLFPVLVEAVR